MNKYQYLIFASPGQSLAAFRQRVFDEYLPQLQAANPARVKVSLTEEPPPKLTLLPLRSNGFALMSVWNDADPTPAAWRQDVSVCGYRVTESVPRAYDRSWPDGETSPGVVLLTLLRKKPGVSDARFMHEWHRRHTPKALRIHPLWSYIRNVIEQAVIQGSPEFDGIVEEHFSSRADVLNPVRMFGGPLRFIPHMLEVYRHVTQFLDLKQCENYLLTEVWVKS